MKKLLILFVFSFWQADNAYVQYVIDGDTFIIHNESHIRLIGVNTPEINHKYPQYSGYYAHEAKNYLKKLLEDKQVKLEYDKEYRDKYGRILCYVYLDTLFINAELVRKGYARVMTIPPNTKYKKLFTKLEKRARLKNKGLWARN